MEDRRVWLFVCIYGMNVMSVAHGRSIQQLTLYTQQVTWNQANLICQQHGQTLVQIQDNEMRPFIQSLKMKSPWDNYGALFPVFWIGLVKNDTVSTAYVWSSSCKALDNDLAYFPINHVASTGDFCALETFSAGEAVWFTSSCSERHPFVCMRNGGSCQIDVLADTAFEEGFRILTRLPIPLLATYSASQTVCLSLPECWAFSHNTSLYTDLMGVDVAAIVSDNLIHKDGSTVTFINCFIASVDSSSFSAPVGIYSQIPNTPCDLHLHTPDEPQTTTHPPSSAAPETTSASTLASSSTVGFYTTYDPTDVRTSVFDVKTTSYVTTERTKPAVADQTSTHETRALSTDTKSTTARRSVSTDASVGLTARVTPHSAIGGDKLTTQHPESTSPGDLATTLDRTVPSHQTHLPPFITNDPMRRMSTSPDPSQERHDTTTPPDRFPPSTVLLGDTLPHDYATASLSASTSTTALLDSKSSFNSSTVQINVTSSNLPSDKVPLHTTGRSYRSTFIPYTTGTTEKVVESTVTEKKSSSAVDTPVPFTKAGTSTWKTSVDKYCDCDCSRFGFNATDHDEFLRLLLLALTKDKSEFSSYRRRFISVVDQRPSAQNVGIIGMALLTAALGCVVLLDLTSIRRDLAQLQNDVSSTCCHSDHMT